MSHKYTVYYVSIISILIVRDFLKYATFLFQRLREAILNTQKNVKFQPVEDTLDGKLQPTLFSSRSTTNNYCSSCYFYLLKVMANYQ